jgi:hypothetical protein
MPEDENEDVASEAGYDPDDHQAKSDADTLRSAQEIRSDPKRHQKALTHLQAHAKMSRMATANESRSFSRKTGARMKQAFGKGQGAATSPFQATLDQEGSK